MIKRILQLAIINLSLFTYSPGQGIPGGNDQQRAAVAQMNADLAPQVESLAAARASMVEAAFVEPRDESTIQAKADAVAAAELALANARAQALATLQSSSAKLTPEQVAALIAQRGAPRNDQRGTIPNITAAQIEALTQLTNQIMPLTHDLNEARAAMSKAALAEPHDDSAVRAKAEALKQAELALANAQAGAFTKIQSSHNRLASDQKKAFVEMGGSFAGVAFTQPNPLNFADHDGYTSLFDGASLKDWDGNPKFWRVEDGAIVGESTKQNPSGNSYLVYRGMEAKDFTLKFEIKVEGDGGSGFQYRSKTGVPWLANIADNVTANVGPVNLNWMMTGPQADFWPSSRDWSGQFYSENTPMRILAWRGQVVEGAGLSKKQLMGNVGDRQVLGGLVKMNDWNQYTVIARGGTLMHILNGQLMAVMVDDDPASSNNQSGLFGIEIEATTRVSVRNIWVKKMN
jgi:Spy/CpxP family protein refolding chaperone